MSVRALMAKSPAEVLVLVAQEVAEEAGAVVPPHGARDEERRAAPTVGREEVCGVGVEHLEDLKGVAPPPCRESGGRGGRWREGGMEGGSAGGAKGQP